MAFMPWPSFGQWLRRRFGGSGGGAPPIAYSLRDLFTTALAAGSVNGTSAEPTGGTRTVIDTESKLSLANNKAVFASGKAVPAYGDPAIWWPAQTRSVGRVFILEVTALVLSGKILAPGWATAQTGEIVNGYSFVVNGLTDLRLRTPGIALIVVGAALDVSTTYKLIIALNSTGAQYFIQGGIFTYPTLIYPSPLGSTATLYPGNINHSASYTSSVDEIPDTATFLARPVISDGFSGTFGTTDGLGHTDAANPIGSGGGGVAWTQVGTWGNSAGKASCSALSGGLGIAHAEGVTKDVFVSAALTRSAGIMGVVGRYADASNYIYAYHDGTNVGVKQRLAGVETDLVAAVAQAYSAGAALRLEMDGVNCQVFYNEVRKGSSASINAALTATRHGLYTTDTGNTFDNAVVIPRGTANEHAGLTPFF